jgi:Golgi nucleoside diphosphatase
MSKPAFFMGILFTTLVLKLWLKSSRKSQQKQSSSGTHVVTYIKTLQNGTIDVCVHIANSLGFRVLVTLLDLGFSGLGFRVLV